MVREKGEEEAQKKKHRRDGRVERDEGKMRAPLLLLGGIVVLSLAVARALSCVCSPLECDVLTDEDCPGGLAWDPCRYRHLRLPSKRLGYGALFVWNALPLTPWRKSLYSIAGERENMALISSRFCTGRLDYSQYARKMFFFLINFDDFFFPLSFEEEEKGNAHV